MINSVGTGGGSSLALLNTEPVDSDEEYQSKNKDFLEDHIHGSFKEVKTKTKVLSHLVNFLALTEKESDPRVRNELKHKVINVFQTTKKELTALQYERPAPSHQDLTFAESKQFDTWLEEHEMKSQIEGVGSDPWKSSFIGFIDYLANSKIHKKNATLLDCFMQKYVSEMLKEENEIIYQEVADAGSELTECYKVKDVARKNQERDSLITFVDK